MDDELCCKICEETIEFDEDDKPIAIFVHGNSAVCPKCMAEVYFGIKSLHDASKEVT